MTDSSNSDMEHGRTVRRENGYGVEKTYVQTSIGTTVVETPKRINNPVTGRTEDLTNLSEDGYCRRFLATLSALNGPDVVDFGSSPVATFDKDRWELREQDGSYVLVKREAVTSFEELVLDENCAVDTRKQ